jgi:hypothetical protein
MKERANNGGRAKCAEPRRGLDSTPMLGTHYLESHHAGSGTLPEAAESNASTTAALLKNAEASQKSEQATVRSRIRCAIALSGVLVIISVFISFFERYARLSDERDTNAKSASAVGHFVPARAC